MVGQRLCVRDFDWEVAKVRSRGKTLNDYKGLAISKTVDTGNIYRRDGKTDLRLIYATRTSQPSSLIGSANHANKC